MRAKELKIIIFTMIILIIFSTIYITVKKLDVAKFLFNNDTSFNILFATMLLLIFFVKEALCEYINDNVEKNISAFVIILSIMNFIVVLYKIW